MMFSITMMYSSKSSSSFFWISLVLYTVEGLSSLPRSETQAGPHVQAQALPQGGVNTPRRGSYADSPASPGGLVQILSVQARLEAHDVPSISFNKVIFCSHEPE